MKLPIRHQEFNFVLIPIMDTWHDYLNALTTYYEVPKDFKNPSPRMEARDKLSATGLAFEQAWKTASHAHSRLNQSRPFRTDLFGHE